MTCSQEFWSGFSGSVCHRRWFDSRDRYDKAKRVMIPARRRLVLRGMRGKRPLQRSREAGWTESGVQGQASSPECPAFLHMGLARR